MPVVKKITTRLDIAPVYNGSEIPDFMTETDRPIMFVFLTLF